MGSHDPLLFELDGVRFGDGQAVRVVTFDPGAAEIEVGDIAVPGRAGMLLGRDVERGTTWSWSLTTLEQDERAGRTAAAALERAWRRSADLAPTQAQELRYTLAGRTRLVYGRARKWSPIVASHFIVQGVGQVVADFMVTDPLHYDDVEQSVRLASIPPSIGGLVAPIVGPIKTSRNSDVAASRITVGGDAPAPLRVSVTGPIADPVVMVGAVRIALVGNVPAGQTITVDARAGTVRRQDGVHVPGMLAPTCRMADLVAAPGVHPVTFSGGGAAIGQLTLGFRNAWRSL